MVRLFKLVMNIKKPVVNKLLIKCKRSSGKWSPGGVLFLLANNNLFFFPSFIFYQIYLKFDSYDSDVTFPSKVDFIKLSRERDKTKGKK